MELEETNRYWIEKYLDNTIKRIKKALIHLLYYQLKTHSQLKKMLVTRSKVGVDYLYFLPDKHCFSFAVDILFHYLIHI